MPQREFNSNTADEIALLDASIRGDLPTVKRLLAQGLDPNTPDMREDPWNVTPLMHSAGNGHLEVVSELLRAKAKVNLTDKSFPGEGGGETALHYAAFKGDIAAAKLLLEGKADVNKVSRFGRKPCQAGWNYLSHESRHEREYEVGYQSPKTRCERQRVGQPR